jgi:hypothetical protein
MNAVSEGYNNKLKNRLFSCLCERESEGEWEACLDSIIIEFMGVPEKERTINYYIIFYKLNSCKYLSYKYFRKNIFEVMSLLGKDGGTK